jgi:hypothetical protein
MAKFLLQIRESYHIGPFTLDSVAKDPTGSLNALEKYDLAIIAKPTEMFSDAGLRSIYHKWRTLR